MELKDIRPRLVELGFKQATQGLTPAEEEEMRRLNEALAHLQGQGDGRLPGNGS